MFKKPTFWGSLIIESKRAVLLITQLLFFIWILIGLGLMSLVRLAFWICQNIDTSTASFGKFLNILFHTDVEALEKEISHNKT